MKTVEVDNCQFAKWYKLFRNVTIKSKILKLPDTFLEYLHADGVVLPDNGDDSDNDRKTTNDDSDAESWCSSDCNEIQVPDFKAFDTEIKAAIKYLGGAVLPKLNWSSPKDAIWISCGNTMKCIEPSDVYLLLKSSEFITHDLTQPYIYCDDVLDEATVSVTSSYTLVLRQWQQIHPAGEFRCFVSKRQLIGICQRHASCHYDFIKDDQEGIVEDIKQIFNGFIKEKFPSESYVFDVYRKEKGRVVLIDFNPFHSMTDGLLFDWDELNNWSLVSNSPQEPVFRFVETEAGVQPSPYSCYTMPLDFVHLTKGEDPNKLIDLLNLKIQSQNDEVGSSDEEHVANSIPSEESNDEKR